MRTCEACGTWKGVVRIVGELEDRYICKDCQSKAAQEDKSYEAYLDAKIYSNWYEREHDC